MTGLVNRQLAGVMTVCAALGCGAPDASPEPPTPRADTPVAYDRQPPIGFASRVEDPNASLFIEVGPTSLLVSRSGELMKAVNLLIRDDTCSRSHLVYGSTGGQRLDVASQDSFWMFVDRNPCRHERSPSFSERVTREPLPSARLQMDRLVRDYCPSPAPRAAPAHAHILHVDAQSSYVDVARGLDVGITVPFVDGDLIAPRYDGRLQWRGVVVDELGRPTDVWVEEPEPNLVESNEETRELKWLQNIGGTYTRDCPVDVYPLRQITAELRRPRRHAAIRINWYDHVQLPFEIWSEGDGLAEGLYVAYADDGTPLVVGDYVLGTRHGLWYYFGWRGSPRRQTIVAIDDYFLGEVRDSWRAPDDVRDPLEDPKEPWQRRRGRADE